MPANPENINRTNLMKKVGTVSQLGGTRSIELQNGNQRGVRAIDFNTGTGFAFTVVPDRGMDVFAASFCGNSLCWHSPVGVAGPAFYDPKGLGWLWNFPGGLVTTCGLTQVGSPNEDQGEQLGQHGRASNIPARNVAHGSRWEKAEDGSDQLVMFAEGSVLEASVFGHQLLLTRRISAKLGENCFFIHDTVENIGHEVSPHMILYHCNIGYPVLDDDSRLLSPTESITPLSEGQEHDLEYQNFSGPNPHYSERVYDHKMKPESDGTVRVALVNENFGSKGLGVYIRYNHRQLPRFTQWKMLGEGTYVVGMEPGNCSVKGRAAAREAGELVELQPGEAREYDLEIGVMFPGE